MTDLARSRYRNDTRDTLAAGRCLAGLTVVGVFWSISWLQLRPVSDYYFFPANRYAGMHVHKGRVDGDGAEIALWYGHGDLRVVTEGATLINQIR